LEDANVRARGIRDEVGVERWKVREEGEDEEERAEAVRREEEEEEVEDRVEMSLRAAAACTAHGQAAA
jgi:hypothetical protein